MSIFLFQYRNIDLSLLLYLIWYKLIKGNDVFLVMNWQARSDLGIGIREGSLLLATIFGILSYLGYLNGMEFGWQLLLTAAGAVFSIWVTLVIIERAIKEDREQQWQKVKSLTYMTIINDIRYIVTQTPLDTGTAIDCINLINEEINYPAEFTTNIIIDLSKEIRAEYGYEDDILNTTEISDDELEDLDAKSKQLLSFCRSINYLIEDMKNTLIPRTLLLSSDSEVNLALTRFEAFIREFQEDTKASWDISEISNSVIQLFEELARLYDVLQRKMPPDGDNTYQFKVPSPIY